MLREIKNARFEHRAILGRRWFLVEGGVAGTVTWRRRAFEALLREQDEQPVALLADGRRCTWLFEERFYEEDEGLGADDVLALVRERERRARRKLERAHATLARDGAGAPPRRERIPREIRQAVFERDGGRCVECGSDFDIQYDHVIPFSMGGASTVANLELLCAPCNQRKGAALA